jgi:hypothetical protein
MDDFASATMLRLLLRAMAAHGLAPPLPQPDAARVPLQHKQQAVACIVHAGGLPLLLQLAQQIQHIDGEPLHHALVGARDPHDFLARWQRLERYVHLSHRVRCLAQDALCLTLEPTSTRGAPPLAAESVAVLGAWIGALRTIGCRGLRVAIGDQVVHGEGATSAWAAGSADRWQLHWLSTDPASAMVPPSRRGPAFQPRRRWTARCPGPSRLPTWPAGWRMTWLLRTAWPMRQPRWGCRCARCSVGWRTPGPATAACSARCGCAGPPCTWRAPAPHWPRSAFCAALPTRRTSHASSPAAPACHRRATAGPRRRGDRGAAARRRVAGWGLRVHSPNKKPVNPWRLTGFAIW